MDRKQIEGWFENHKATLIESGDLKILEWKQPDSICYYIRYVFDGNKVYITGDLGSAVFELTWNANVHNFDISLSYFHEKMTAYHDSRYSYDAKEAKRRMIEWKEDLLRDRVFDTEFEKQDFFDNINALINGAEACESSDQFAYEYINSNEYNDFITLMDNDYWEWIYNIGDCIPDRVHAYLIGLQMASKQLKEKE